MSTLVDGQSNDKDTLIGKADRDARLLNEQNAQRAVANGGDTNGAIETSISENAKAKNVHQSKNDKDKNKKLSTAELLMMLNQQINTLGAEIADLNYQIDALNEVRDLLERGELDINNPAHQSLLRRGHVPQDEWDNIDLQKVDGYLKDRVTRRDAKQEEQNDKQRKLEEIKETRDAAVVVDLKDDTKNNITTELGDDLKLVNEIDKASGFNIEGQSEALAGFDDKDDLFSNDFSFDEAALESSDLQLNSTTSFAKSTDAEPPFDRECISGEFKTAAVGEAEPCPAPSQDMDLALSHTVSGVKPLVPGQAYS